MGLLCSADSWLHYPPVLILRWGSTPGAVQVCDFGRSRIALDLEKSVSDCNSLAWAAPEVMTPG